MKILVVCQYYYPEPFRVTDICETLYDNGHEVTVLTGLPNYPEGVVPLAYRNGKKRTEVINGVKIIRCFEFGRGKGKLKLFLNYLSYALTASIKAFLLKDVFDVVIVNQLSPILMGIPAMVYKKKHCTKILFYCLDLWPASLVAGGVKKNSLFYRIFGTISKWIYESADLIFVTSSMFKVYFRDVLKMETDHVFHLPQYAEDLFVERMEDKIPSAEVRKSFNFVFAGNIGEVQSVETIINAANELKIFENIHFHIVGDGSRLDACKKLAEEMDLQNVIFYGRKPIEQMPQFYSMADAMLITLKRIEALSYTLPGKVQSYMAAGKPIIGAINGEASKVISDSACGFTCEAEDHIAFADLIRKFCDSEEKEQMKENAQSYYTNHYTKKQFIAVLQNALINLGA